MTTKHLKSIISGHSALADLAKLAQHKASLNDRITDALPAELASLISALQVDEKSGLMTVIVTTGERASRLRYAESQLLSASRDAGAIANRCKIQVRPITRKPEPDS